MARVLEGRSGSAIYISIGQGILTLRFCSLSRQEKGRQLFVGCHMIEVFAVPPGRPAEVFLLAPISWFHYNPTRVLQVRAPQVFSYCTMGMDMNCREDKRRVDMISRTEKALMTVACFFSRCVVMVARRISSVIFSSIPAPTVLLFRYCQVC